MTFIVECAELTRFLVKAFRKRNEIFETIYFIGLCAKVRGTNVRFSSRQHFDDYVKARETPPPEETELLQTSESRKDREKERKKGKCLLPKSLETDARFFFSQQAQSSLHSAA